MFGFFLLLLLLTRLKIFGTFKNSRSGVFFFFLSLFLNFCFHSQSSKNWVESCYVIAITQVVGFTHIKATQIEAKLHTSWSLGETDKCVKSSSLRGRSIGPNRRGCSGTPLPPITHHPSQILSTVDAPLFDLSFAFSDSPSSIVLFYLTFSNICDTALKPLSLNWLHKEVGQSF